jgi:selenium metabolism protein YedF
MIPFSPEKATLIMITNNGMGHADVELGQKLIGTYLKILQESNVLPEAICFYTEGVKLVVEDSPVLPQLKALHERGVKMVICRTCLDYFRLTEKVAVGIIGGMPDIIEAQRQADKVITL